MSNKNRRECECPECKNYAMKYKKLCEECHNDMDLYGYCEEHGDLCEGCEVRGPEGLYKDGYCRRCYENNE